MIYEGLHRNVQPFAVAALFVKGVGNMAIKTYARTDKSKLTENFSISEFHCTGKECGCTETLHDEALSAYLQQIRDHFGKPIHITSGYRCAKHNASIGGSGTSRHMKGQAADFTITGISPAQIAAYAEQLGILGIGLYDDFVHIDTRSTKFFWYGHAQVARDTFQEVIPQTYVYLLTCRVNGQEALHTLMFDPAVGNHLQQIGNHQVAVKMENTETGAVFCVCSIGTDQAQILQVTKLQV